MKTRVITFRTNDPLYEYAGRMFGASLDRLGIEHEVYVVPPFKGGWCEANHWRVDFLLEQLWKRAEPILWLDVDTVVFRDFRPVIESLEREEVDFAGHWIGDELLFGSVLYFGRTFAARRLLMQWKEALPNLHGVASQMDERFGNHPPLNVAVRRMIEGRTKEWPFKYAKLPQEMAFWTDIRVADDRMKHFDPMIECFQISTVMKHPQWIAMAQERQVQACLYAVREDMCSPEGRRPACHMIPGVRKSKPWRTRVLEAIGSLMFRRPKRLKASRAHR